jgi:hypothetical protein
VRRYGSFERGGTESRRRKSASIKTSSLRKSATLSKRARGSSGGRKRNNCCARAAFCDTRRARCASALSPPGSGARPLGDEKGSDPGGAERGGSDAGRRRRSLRVTASCRRRLGTSSTGRISLSSVELDSSEAGSRTLLTIRTSMSGRSTPVRQGHGQQNLRGSRPASRRILHGSMCEVFAANSRPISPYCRELTRRGASSLPTWTAVPTVAY